MEYFCNMCDKTLKKKYQFLLQKHFNFHSKTHKKFDKCKHIK